MPDLIIGEETLERMVRAVEEVRDRLRRATGALERHAIPYAVVGGNAVAAWVATVDEAAVRNTQDVDLAIRRDDLERAKGAMAEAGFVHRNLGFADVFLDGPSRKVRSAVVFFYSGETPRESLLLATPDVSESTLIDGRRVLFLQPLVAWLLDSARNEDRMLIRDVIDVGLVDETWPARFPPELATRLRHLLERPEG